MLFPSNIKSSSSCLVRLAVIAITLLGTFFVPSAEAKVGVIDSTGSYVSLEMTFNSWLCVDGYTFLGLAKNQVYNSVLAIAVCDFLERKKNEYNVDVANWELARQKKINELSWVRFIKKRYLRRLKAPPFHAVAKVTYLNPFDLHPDGRAAPWIVATISVVIRPNEKESFGYFNSLNEIFIYKDERAYYSDVVILIAPFYIQSREGKFVRLLDLADESAEIVAHEEIPADKKDKGKRFKCMYKSKDALAQCMKRSIYVFSINRANIVFNVSLNSFWGYENFCYIMDGRFVEVTPKGAYSNKVCKWVEPLKQKMPTSIVGQSVGTVLMYVSHIDFFMNKDPVFCGKLSEGHFVKSSLTGTICFLMITNPIAQSHYYVWKNAEIIKNFSKKQLSGDGLLSSMEDILD